MQNKIPVSVVMITKNEEHDIERALQSAQDFAEIIIVDSFSTDATLPIAKRYTHKIFQHEWPGFAIQKQRAIDYATFPWVLILDADEKISTFLRNEIASILQQPSPAAGYYLPRKNFFLGKWIQHCGLGNDFTLRLFRKDCSHMEMREVHEKVIVKGKTDYLKGYLEHYSHIDLADYLNKTHYYADLAAQQMLKEGKTISGFGLFLKPLYAFIKIFFIKQGFRDGLQGFLLAKLFSFSTFLKYAKLKEKQLMVAAKIAENSGQ